MLLKIYYLPVIKEIQYHIYLTHKKNQINKKKRIVYARIYNNLSLSLSLSLSPRHNHCYVETTSQYIP